MASPRYTRDIKPDDLKPEEHIELTNKQKRENFWYYHKWHILAIIVAATLVFSFVYEIVTRVEPDYTIGIINETPLPMGCAETLQTAFEGILDDLNGDGKVVVMMDEFTLALNGQEIADPNVQAANVTRLSGNLQMGQSMLFFTKDIKTVQETQCIFAYNDGTIAPETGADYSKMGVKWSDSPLLSKMELGNVVNFDGTQGKEIQDIMEGFYLVKRSYEGTYVAKNGKLDNYYNSNMALFDKIKG